MKWQNMHNNDLSLHIMNDISHLAYRDLSLSHDEHNQKVILNSDGYRSPEFKNNIDILALGCSMTFGIGVNQEAIWPAILSSKTNLDYNNVSETGASAMHIVIAAMKYMKKYGNPKNIIAVFPDFNRFRIPIDGKVFKKHGKSNIITDGFATKEKSKYFKLPVDPDDIFTIEYTEYLNLAFIKMLEQYCISSKINLIWTTWVPLNNTDQYVFNTFFDNFIYTYKNPDTLQQMNCHKEYKEMFSDCFDHGTDGNINNAHFGAHWHIHLAEVLEKILNDNTRN
jgi:hypothetical protein